MVRGIGLQLGVDEQCAADERHPAGHQPARADTIRRPAGEGSDQDDQHRHGKERDPCLHGAVPEHVLHEEGDEEEDAEHREGDEEGDRVGTGERRVAEERGRRTSAAAGAARAGRRRRRLTAATAKRPKDQR